jgi:hypothetical protein
MASWLPETMRKLAALCLFLASATVQAATYRWMDEQGRVHYGDVIPNKDAGRGNVELDKQGRVKKETQRTQLSPEERRQMEAEQSRREEARRAQEAQQRRDRALLTTYVSESEIDLARDRALEQEEAHLKGLHARLKAATDKLAYANGQLAPYGKTGQGAPRAFTQMRDEAQAEMAKLGDLIPLREKAMAETKQRYEADKLRFRELKANPPR